MLDPVGAGASKLRTNTACRLLEEVQFAVIRGNSSELKALAVGSASTRGVDADAADAVTEESWTVLWLSQRVLLREPGSVIAIHRMPLTLWQMQTLLHFVFRNRTPLMSRITGTGCQLSAMTAAYVTANPETPLEATAAAVCAMGLCGEIAYQRLTAQDGNSSYRNYIIDAIYHLTPDALEQGANYEVR